MPAPLSNDLRIRMLQAMTDEGLSCKATARRYGVAASTAIRLKQHVQKHKTHKPLKVGGHRLRLLSEHHDRIIFLLSETPDMTLSELQDFLRHDGVSVSLMCIHRHLVRTGFTLKKRRCSRRNKTGRMSGIDGNSGKNTKDG